MQTMYALQIVSVNTSGWFGCMRLMLVVRRYVQVTCFNNLPDWRHLGLVLSECNGSWCRVQCLRGLHPFVHKHALSQECMLGLQQQFAAADKCGKNAAEIITPRFLGCHAVNLGSSAPCQDQHLDPVLVVSLSCAGPSIKTIQQGSTYFTVYPERVLWSEAAATCKQLPGGQLAILDSQGLVDKVSRDLLDTLPFQTAVRSAWVGATGNNTAFNPAAPNISEMANGSLQAQVPPREQPAIPPEATMRWAGGAQVAPGLLRRPNTLTQLWTVHDVVWSQQYVPESSKDVCGRVMVQLPSSTGPVDPASVLPGVWYYDCAKPAAFICQSKHLASWHTQRVLALVTHDSNTAACLCAWQQVGFVWA